MTEQSTHLARLSADTLSCVLRQDLASFIEASFYKLEPGKELISARYIDLIAHKLEAVRTGAIKRLIINLPPRYLKSHCASVAFPAWVLGHCPDKKLFCVSYGQALADELGERCLRLMRSRWYIRLFGHVLSERQAADRIQTVRHGGRIATSVGGALTGRGADIIIVDDPQKAEDALSACQRQALNSWFDHSVVSRLDSKTDGAIIIVMQRLHADDLVGHAIKQQDWDVLALPIVAENDESYLIESVLGRVFFKRRRGEFLDPHRDEATHLDEIKARMSEDAFACQYMQNPDLPTLRRARSEAAERQFSMALCSGDPLWIGRAWLNLEGAVEAGVLTEAEALKGYQEFIDIKERLEQLI